MTTIPMPYSPSIPRRIENTGEAHAVVRVIAPLMVMGAGTGGLMTINSAVKMPEYCCVSSVRINIESARSTNKKIDTRSPAENVANIRDVFAISMSELAAVLSATRPTVYAWLEGKQEPKPEAIKRIQQLSLAADVFEQAKIERLDKLLRRPILEGRSLLDMLKDKDNEDPLSVLPLVKEISEKEANTRRESKGSSKHRRSLDDVMSESSIAIDFHS